MNVSSDYTGENICSDNWKDVIYCMTQTVENTR